MNLHPRHLDDLFSQSNQQKVNLIILGATGSIGLSTLEVIQLNKNLTASVLVSHQNHQLLAQLIEKHRPQMVYMTNDTAYCELKKYSFKQRPKFASSFDEIFGNELNGDLVMSAIATSAGLKSTLMALEKGKTVLLANKESLVMAGHLMIKTAKKHQARIIPVDSEHNAILQCLPSDYEILQSDLINDFDLDKIILTASGGAIYKESDIKNISLAKALSHPNWSMGKKITVDSNTMVNKGLEMIEASYLFDLPPEMIECLIHPQSIVHGMVYFKDRSVIVSMANPDMKVAISYAISYALKSNYQGSIKRIKNQTQSLNLIEHHLEFYPIDAKKYPCFNLAKQCLIQKGSYPLFFNIANEVAVESFLAEKITFTKIEYLINQCLNHAHSQEINSLKELDYFEDCARKIANSYVRGLSY